MTSQFTTSQFIFHSRALKAAALALAILLAQTLAAHAEIIPSEGRLDFSVIRNDDKIGTHRITFRQADDRIDVDIETRIAVKMAFITVYRFEQDAHEVWVNGALDRMDVRTHDDGTDHTLKVEKEASGDLRVVGDGGKVARSAPAGAIPASLWNPGFVRTGRMMNSIVGTPLDIKVSFVGEEALDRNGRKVPARHYSVIGEFEREVWYDMNWVLVRIELKGKDGSPVRYVLN